MFLQAVPQVMTNSIRCRWWLTNAECAALDLIYGLQSVDYIFKPLLNKTNMGIYLRYLGYQLTPWHARFSTKVHVNVSSRL